MGSHPENSKDLTKNVLIPTKHNLTRPGKSLWFEIDEKGRFDWQGEWHGDAEQLLGDHAEPKDNRIQEAKDFLLEVLADGSVPSDEIKEQAKEQGLAVKTLFRAKGELGIKARKKGYEDGKWYWELQTDHNQDIGGSHTLNDDHIRQNNNLTEDGQDSQRKEYVHLQETRDGTYPDDQRLYGFLRTQLPNHVDDWPEWYQDLFDEQASCYGV